MEKFAKLALMAWSEMRWAERFGPRMTAATACALLAFIAVLAALASATAALWLTLEPAVGAAGASLWVALILLAAAGAFAAAAHTIFYKNNYRTNGLSHGGSPLSDDLLLEMRRGVGAHKGSALISAILAGLALGATRDR